MIERVMKPVNLEDVDPDNIPFPLLGTPKIDGIRFHVREDGFYSASNKKIPNILVQRLAAFLPVGSDGEFFKSSFSETTEVIMSYRGPIDGLEVNVFDLYSEGVGYANRVRNLRAEWKLGQSVGVCWGYEDQAKPRKMLEGKGVKGIERVQKGVKGIEPDPSSVPLPTEAQWQATHWHDCKIRVFLGFLSKGVVRFRILNPTIIRNRGQMDKYSQVCLSLGYEGSMYRSYDSMYKFGRSTPLIPGLIRVKPFTDCEARIIGVEEQFENNNPKVTDSRGISKRSTHAAGRTVGKGILGKFVCELGEYVPQENEKGEWTDSNEDGTSNRLWMGNGATFKVSGGVGITDEFRRKVWASPDDYIGQVIKVKYLKGYDVPRSAQFCGFRDERD